ncbi:MAG: acetate kinase [Armatimonadetes bacterium CG_4_9_14_3_um_filter_58_7]|nr:MAG: acetate kinase [Armatimonadetes bacterium CG_4_9_14_3_um_filter_58_7]
MQILVVNVGSTSLKFKLFDMSAETTDGWTRTQEQVLASGKVDRVGGESSVFSYQLGDAPRQEQKAQCPHQRAAIQRVLETLTDSETGILTSLDDVQAVGFKPVHAKGIAESVVINEAVIQAMEEYVPLAPAHNPPYIEAFGIFQELLPGKPLVGVFEPAFHTTIPDYARTYGIPYEWTEKHAIRRYGFHGASHRYVSWRAPELAGVGRDAARVISCHLGGSSSICAIRGGKSVDTSMGFSPQSGLPNATRNGDIDPFIALYMMEKEGLSVGEIREALSKSGGLAGISGLSGDIRDLEEAAEEGNERARLALRVLVHEVKKYVGAYTAVLEGLDILAFTGGIGENGMNIRRDVCSGLECLGVEIDLERNAVGGAEGIISTEKSPVKIVVVLANEELVIARETMQLMSDPGSRVRDFSALD